MLKSASQGVSAPGGVCSGGCLLWGVSAPSAPGGCLLRGCLLRGCLLWGCLLWGCLLWGCLLQGGVWSQGVGVVSQHALRQTPPWTESQMPVKTLPWPNFVAAFNYRDTLLLHIYSNVVMAPVFQKGFVLQAISDKNQITNVHKNIIKGLTVLCACVHRRLANTDMWSEAQLSCYLHYPTRTRSAFSPPLN